MYKKTIKNGKSLLKLSKKCDKILVDLNIIKEEEVMKNGVKKFLAMSLALTMAAGVMAGCGEKTGGTSTSKTSTATTASTSGETGGVVLSESGQYPIVKEGKLELTVFTMSMPNVQDFETNDFTKFLEEKTGIELTFVTAGRDEYEEKLNMLLQSGDYPDVILGGAPNLAKYGVKEGIVIPLDDYINEKNLPNYLKLAANYDINKTKEADGKIYSLAGINDCYHCELARKMWVNQSYLDQMGIKAPTTTEEFMEACKKFLELKPDGVAVAGAAKGWHTRMQDFLMGAFTFVPSTSSTLLVRDYVVLNSETKQVEEVANTDAYRNGLRWLRDLYKMGAIYDGNFTQTSEELKRLVNQEDEPVLFFTSGVNTDIIDPDNNNELYRKYVPMAPIKGPDGTQIAWTVRSSGFRSGGFCVTDKCENVEAALRLADFFYSETGDLSSQYGAEEGKDWVLKPEGKVGLNGEPALYEVLNAYSPDAQNHDWQDVGIRVAPAPYRLGQAVDANVDLYTSAGLEKLLFEASKNLYEPYKDNTKLHNLSALKLTDEESTNVSTMAVEIEKLIEETSVAFITGTKDIETEWDSYKDALNKAGLEEVLKTYQTAYDRQSK